MTGESETSRDTEAPVPRHRAWQSALPEAAQAAWIARRATRAVLGTWQLAHLEETALLLVSELVTNSVRHARHGGAVLTLRLEISAGKLRIEVGDGDPRWPQPVTPGRRDESGFGLVLVAALAADWGVTDTVTGKAVWAELGGP